MAENETSEPEHTLLVGVSMHGATREQAMERLMLLLPTPTVDSGVEDWWLADDDRVDGSDRDSAVFCKTGHQREATAMLRKVGLAP